MNIENLAYPWTKDVDDVKSQIGQLKQEIMNLKMQNDNLKYFCHQLYDRLNLNNSYNSSAMYKP